MKKNKENKCQACCPHECENEACDALFRGYMDEIAAASAAGESIELILSEMNEEYEQSRRMIAFLRYRMQVIDVTLDFIHHILGEDEDDTEDEAC